MEGGNSGGVTCKLDNHLPTNCESKKISYSGLLDGHHTLEVCINGSGAAASCATHNWTVDTVRPTAGVSVASPFTRASRALVNISFSEACTGRGGFQCTNNHCNFLVYGSGAVLPSTLKVIEPDLRFSLVITISDEVSYGRLVLVMDKDFCTDSSGNMFTRTENSRFFLHFDRRIVTVNMRSFAEEKLVIIDNKIRTVEATNDHKNLQIYLHFSSPVLNSSSEILGVLQTSVGELSPTNSTTTLGNRRFGFLVQNLLSISVVCVNLEASFIIGRQGTPVSPTQPMTFLYDSERPSVSLTSKRSREHKVPRIIIRFEKPVFDFNSSSSILISGGHLKAFHKISRSVYSIEIEMVDRMVSLKIPENVTCDIAGNKNIESNLLQVIQHHDSIPLISYIVSTITTVTFVATTFASAFVSFSTGSLHRLFASTSKSRVLQIRQQLQTLKKGALSVLDYLAHVTILAEALRSAGDSITDEELGLMMLTGLGMEYEAFITSVTTRFEDVNFIELQGLLINHEIRMKIIFESQDLISTNMAKQQAGTRGKEVRSVICQIYTKKGHGALACYNRLNTKRFPSLHGKRQTANLVTTSKDEGGNSIWYSDSGCGDQGNFTERMANDGLHCLNLVRKKMEAILEKEEHWIHGTLD